MFLARWSKVLCDDNNFYIFGNFDIEGPVKFHFGRILYKKNWIAAYEGLDTKDAERLRGKVYNLSYTNNLILEIRVACMYIHAKLGLATDLVIKAIAMLEFEDGLQTGVLPEGY